MSQLWNDLVREYGPAIYRVAWRILGHADDVDDVVQDVFMEAHQFAQRNEVASWIGFLKRLCVCRSLDRLLCRQPAVPLDNISIEDGSPGPEANAIARELESRLRDAIGELPQQQAEVFCLRYFDNLTNSQIAETLNLSNSAVATSLNKARTRLAEMLTSMKGASS